MISVEPELIHSRYPRWETFRRLWETFGIWNGDDKETDRKTIRETDRGDRQGNRLGDRRVGRQGDRQCDFRRFSGTRDRH